MSGTGSESISRFNIVGTTAGVGFVQPAWGERFDGLSAPCVATVTTPRCGFFILARLDSPYGIDPKLVDCVIECNVEVHAWSGFFDYTGWKALALSPAVLEPGRRSRALSRSHRARGVP